MASGEMSPDDLTKAGLEALVEALGPTGMIRFMQQFDPGEGDYTRERHNWLPDDVSEIMNQLEKNEKES